MAVLRGGFFVATTMAVTPGRHTRLILEEFSTPTLTPGWQEKRMGPLVRATRTAQISSTDVKNFGGAWILDADADDPNNFVVLDGVKFLTPTNVNLADDWTSRNTFHNSGDLPGVTVDPSVVNTGVPQFQKDVPANGTYDKELDDDAQAVPKPPLPTEMVGMARVLSGKETYPANAGYGILFDEVWKDMPPDTAWTFYFGGPVETTTQGAHGGEYCLTLRGNGTALLFEYTGSEWVQRFQFPWRTHQGNSGFDRQWITIQPFGRDRIGFSTYTIPGGGAETFPGFTLLGTMIAIAATALTLQTTRPATFVYRNNPKKTGYVARRYATGPGTIRMDVRKDLRLNFGIGRSRPKESGTLVDAPFWVPFPVPPGTPVYIRPIGYAPPGTSITTRLFHQPTGAEVPASSTNLYATVAGNQAYYAAFQLNADDDREQTPVLYGYQVVLGQSRSATSYTQTVLPVYDSVSITGPDLTPDQDSASCVVEDTIGAGVLLGTRARIPAKIAVLDDVGNITSVLFQGEVARAPSQYRAKSGRSFPGSAWRRYEVSMLGEWARIADQISIDMPDYTVDDDAPINPVTGSKPPWKITSIVRDLLIRKCQYPPEMVAIPDWAIRLWTILGEQGDFVLQPGMSVADYLITLTRDYLGSALVFDPNAGAYGMWRLLPNPVPPYGNVLAAFVDSTTPGKLQTYSGSYAAGVGFIEDETLHTYVAPPEANYVLVVGNAGSLDDVGPGKMAQRMYNHLSVNLYGNTADPTHPDYLGRMVPVIHVDYSLSTPEAVNWVCRRLFDRVAHAQKWATFRAPLMLVVDPTDPYQVRPRPLRVNDVVNVMGYLGIVRSCNPNWSMSDKIQMADYEVLLVS